MADPPLARGGFASHGSRAAQTLECNGIASKRKPQRTHPYNPRPVSSARGAPSSPLTTLPTHSQQQRFESPSLPSRLSHRIPIPPLILVDMIKGGARSLDRLCTGPLRCNWKERVGRHARVYSNTSAGKGVLLASVSERAMRERVRKCRESRNAIVVLVLISSVFARNYNPRP